MAKAACRSGRLRITINDTARTSVSYSQTKMVLENLKYNPWGGICSLHSNLMPQVTPLGVKLGSQVCGGTPHAWFQRVMLSRTEHAVGVRIVLWSGTHRWSCEASNMSCMFAEQSAHLRRAPWWNHENTEIQACVEPSSPHTWLHNFTSNGVSHTNSGVAEFSKTIFV